MRKGVGIEVFFTGYAYNVCEKIQPCCIFKDKASQYIYIIVRMVKKTKNKRGTYTFRLK